MTDGPFTDIQVDHRRLRHLLSRLENAKSDAAAGDLLDRLRDYLVGHFGVEEARGGLLDLLCERAPQRRAVIEALRRDHAAFIVEIDRLQSVLSSTPMLTAEVRQQVASLVGALRDHERLEGLLLAEVLEAELGDACWDEVTPASGTEAPRAAHSSRIPANSGD